MYKCCTKSCLKTNFVPHKINLAQLPEIRGCSIKRSMTLQSPYNEMLFYKETVMNLQLVKKLFLLPIFILYINKYDISDTKLNAHYDKDLSPPTFISIKEK